MSQRTISGVRVCDDVRAEMDTMRECSSCDGAGEIRSESWHGTRFTVVVNTCETCGGCGTLPKYQIAGAGGAW